MNKHQARLSTFICDIVMAHMHLANLHTHVKILKATHANKRTYTHSLL